MKILNTDLQTKLICGEPVKLDFGCGPTPRQGFFGVDIIELPGVDAVADLNQSLDLFPSNSVSHIYSSHAFEHIDKFINLMGEINRIIKPDGQIEIVVPHFSNVLGYSDPTHVRLFGLFSMHYFVAPDQQPGKRIVPSFYSNIRFRIESIKIEFYKLTFFDKLFTPFFRRIINLNLGTQMFYERRLSSLYHAAQIRYILTPVK